MNMKRYIGTKIITATPMDRANYNRYRGWELPADERGEDMGMLVEYPYDMFIAPNHPNHKGYISWSPTSVFHKAYHADGFLNFGHALELLKTGERVQRSGWNGKNMFLFMVQGSYNLEVNREPLLSILGEGTLFTYQPHIDMFTANGTIVPWLCSQTDMLAEDWQVYPNAGDQ